MVKNHELYTIGYNGFDKGHNDAPERYSNREEKYPNIVHAEVNVINQFFRKFDRQYWDDNYTLYVYPYLPCIDCANKIYDSGIIKRVVSTDYSPDRWKESFNDGKSYLMSKGIFVEQHPITHVL